MLLVEAALALLALLISLVRPTLGCGSFEKFENVFLRFVVKRGLAVAFIGLSALALRLAVLPIEPIPQPSVHDEFAYLLQADTFARGRLTNPTPPMWVHFETFHVVFQPSYFAKFFPAQGVFLGLGKIV